MVLDSTDDEYDIQSTNGDDVDVDVDVHSNHYRIPKLSNGINTKNGHGIMSLTELAAQNVACHLPFGQVECFQPPVPEPMQCRIAFWSFPQDEEDIRLYTCLANGSANVFIRAEDLISLNCVCDMLQVGFHLSANVRKQYIQDSTNEPDCCKVAITFDRRRITSCSCSCSVSTFWCEHTVAVCLQRIRKPQDLVLRAPVSESLQRLEKNQLQKFAQYLINELPQHIIPAAQKLLDELLSGTEAVIHVNPAAPDPTAGATINEQTSWCLDDTHLSMDIHKILLKQCTAKPTVCSDVQALNKTEPPAATEYSQLLRPIRGREPEGLWNLISICGEMMKRRDSNYLVLLEIMTKEVLRCDKVVTWWFETKVSLHYGSTIQYSSIIVGNHHNNSSSSSDISNSQQCISQYSCSNLCDEIVHLWRLAAMDPNAKPEERQKLHKKFFDWHLEILTKHKSAAQINTSLNNPKSNNKRNLLELFPGFKVAMIGCMIDWSEWDEKRYCLKTPRKPPNKVKPSKLIRKKKKRAVKQQNESEPKPSTSNSCGVDDNELIVNELDSKLESSSLINDFDKLKLEKAENNIGIEVSNLNHDKQNGESNVNSDQIVVNNNVELQQGVDPEPVLAQNEQPNEVANPEPNQEIEQELQVYFMENQAENSVSNSSKPETLEDYININSTKFNDPLEILYSKVEGLHAHGHIEEARRLAIEAANKILSSTNFPKPRQTGAHPRKKSNLLTVAVSEALAKINFLCNVLLEDLAYHNLVFKLVIFGLEIKRSPAATKPLEVKLINQKHDLVTLLKNITLKEEELIVLRDKAQSIQNDIAENNADALTTIIFGNFIFEALVLSTTLNSERHNSDSANNQIFRPSDEAARSNGSYNQAAQYHPVEEHYLQLNFPNPQISSHISEQPPTSQIVYAKIPADSDLGFQVALAALKVKLNFPESDFPLLCEGIRIKRGELALSMLNKYKDDQEKLDQILNNFLDKDLLVPQEVILSASTLNVASTLNPVATKSNIRREVKKNNPSSHDPNQSIEASAYFMFELAKTVLDKAGGNSTTAHLFRPQVVTQNGSRSIHRKLYMCSLRIALYALGLENRTSHGWIGRTFNGRASFIREQALEIGLPAIKFLAENWVGFLTPVEAASIADNAGGSSDAETKRVAAEMAMSCLNYVNHLGDNNIKRILAQCDEQSIEMIEEACGIIEHIAETKNFCADVLFTTAKSLYSLYSNNFANGDNNYYKLKENHVAFYEQQDNGASGWYKAANASSNIPVQGSRNSQYVQHHYHQYHNQQQQHHSHFDQQSQYCNVEPMNQKHWDLYSRKDFIPASNLPSHKYIDYVKAAYRVGLKALDAKTSKNRGSKNDQQKEDGVLWLLQLSKKLDREHLHQLSLAAMKNIENPITLHTICSDLIKMFEPLPEEHIERSKILLPLIDNCLTKFCNLLGHIPFNQKGKIDSILENAQDLTFEASTLTAVDHFKRILAIVEGIELKRSKWLSPETKRKSSWVEILSSCIEQGHCAKCCFANEKRTDYAALQPNFKTNPNGKLK